MLSIVTIELFICLFQKQAAAATAAAAGSIKGITFCVPVGIFQERTGNEIKVSAESGQWAFFIYKREWKAAK